MFTGANASQTPIKMGNHPFGTVWNTFRGPDHEHIGHILHFFSAAAFLPHGFVVLRSEQSFVDGLSVGF